MRGKKNNWGAKKYIYIYFTGFQTTNNLEYYLKYQITYSLNADLL